MRAIRADRLMPSYDPGEMTLYDLLEGTFRVDAERAGTPVPDHATMLARAGLLGERAPAPALDPPPEGRWMVGKLRSISDAEVGKVNESGPFDDFGDAIEGAQEALRSKADERAVETLEALERAY